MTVSIANRGSKYRVKAVVSGQIVSMYDFPTIEKAFNHLKNMVGVVEADLIIQSIISKETYGY